MTYIVKSQDCEIEIRSDIEYVERLLFSNHQPNNDKHSSETPPIPSSKQEDEPEVESDKESAVGEQVLLPDVGSKVDAVYVNVGNVFLKKAGRKSSCLNILIKGKPAYIVGTYFREDALLPTLNYGDEIRIVKTQQFKRAVNREHAQAAKFSITKL